MSALANECKQCICSQSLTVKAVPDQQACVVFGFELAKGENVPIVGLTAGFTPNSFSRAAA